MRAVGDSERYGIIGKIHTIEEYTDLERFLNTVSSLKLLGFKMDIYALFRTLYVALQLGNFLFACYENYEERSHITNVDELESLASLMGVSFNIVKLSEALRTISIQHKVVNIPLNPIVVKDLCDILAREI